MGFDIYEEVTSRIAAQLEAGIVPWHKPWDVSVGRPVNLEGRAYRGVNIMLLGSAGYADPRWGTYKSITEHGGQVRKGEKSSLAVFFKMLDSKTEKDSKGNPKKIPLLRGYRVFNVLQADGIAEYDPEQAETISADEVLQKYADGPKVTTGSTGAWYRLRDDEVSMPPLKAFKRLDDWYGTLYHELTHSTGHPNRLNRPEVIASDGFGGEKYAREELVAEIGASMLCAMVGLEPNYEQSAAYIAAWLKVLQNDKKLIASAAARATASTDLIMGRLTTEKKEVVAA